ncbi:type II/IV secretion system ATPase subunit [Candidatus Woesearchaeota archaeon]|nr:type II/IV secretion system ATPase subunit [Candidatus Woesearchaeota archaeon]
MKPRKRKKAVAVMKGTASKKSAEKLVASSPITKRLIAAKAKKRKAGKTEEEKVNLITSYEFESHDVAVLIRIYSKRGDYVPTYEVNIPQISANTEIVLERIRHELIQQVNLGIIEIMDTNKATAIEDSFKEAIDILIKKYFPNLDEKTLELLKAYLIQKSLGLGDIEILMDDNDVEEIAVNSSGEPIWVYHRKHGWLKTNIIPQSEDQIRHYASTIGRKVGRQITILTPLMDANMGSGDRVNATLAPVSLRGNTITLRQFASKPWTITDFLEKGSIEPFAAAIIWLAVQYEMSVLIAGGTASGKTSMLNVISNFFPPNQRIISIEDTHELQLPRFLHWVPLITRLPNVEGKGEITMLDLLVNSLRMRPDRILVGEIRRKKEAEVLFEAIHTGHSVYATIHANNVHETVTRVTSPPIDVPKTMLPAISLIVVQYRNRRTGIRKLFQIAEITPEATANVLVQADLKKDRLVRVNKSKAFMNSLELYTGMSLGSINKDVQEKELVLKWLMKQKINGVDEVGRAMAEYYINHDSFMKLVRSGKGLN